MKDFLWGMGLAVFMTFFAVTVVIVLLKYAKWLFETLP